LGRKAISLLLSLAHDQTRRSQYSRIRAIPQSLPPSWTSAHLACPGYHSAPPASDRPLRASGVPQTTRRSNVVRQTTRRSSGVGQTTRRSSGVRQTTRRSSGVRQTTRHNSGVRQTTQRASGVLSSEPHTSPAVSGPVRRGTSRPSASSHSCTTLKPSAVCRVRTLGSLHQPCPSGPPQS